MAEDIFLARMLALRNIFLIHKRANNEIFYSSSTLLAKNIQKSPFLYQLQ